MRHTPAPWIAINPMHLDYPPTRSESVYICTGDQREFICELFRGKDKPLTMGNAKHIVKCVNMHDELVRFVKTFEWDHAYSDKVKAILAQLSVD